MFTFTKEVVALKVDGIERLGVPDATAAGKASVCSREEKRQRRISLKNLSEAPNFKALELKSDNSISPLHGPDLVWVYTLSLKTGVTM